MWVYIVYRVSIYHEYSLEAYRREERGDQMQDPTNTFTLARFLKKWGIYILIGIVAGFVVGYIHGIITSLIS